MAFCILHSEEFGLSFMDLAIVRFFMVANEKEIYYP